MVRVRPLALFGAGLLLGASIGLVRAAIPSDTGSYSACYDKKDGTLHLVDSTVSTCTKSQSGPVTWNQVGLQGPAGSPGPQGSPGVLGTLDDVNGLSCANGAGHAQLVTNAYTGESTIACLRGTTGLSADPWNNTPASADAVTVSCGMARDFSGNTYPAGTSDWFKVSFSTSASCPNLEVVLTSNPGNSMRFDITDKNAVPLNTDGYEVQGCFQQHVFLTSPNPVWIRVWAPLGVMTTYTLRVQEVGTTSNCSLN
jgi:hypothetical protein